MKIRKVPAYINRMNKNERKYYRYNLLNGLLLGGYFVWLFTVLIPSLPGLSWQLIGMIIFLAIVLLNYSKIYKYKKLIQFEDKQPTLGDVKQ